MFRLPVLASLIFALSIAGCTASGKTPVGGMEAIANGNGIFELLSLDPTPQFQQASDSFHGFRVLGAANLSSETTQRRLMKAFNEGIRNHDGSAASCFNPRHGVRISRPDGLHEYVVCFECAQVKHFIDGQPAPSVLISTSPRPVFNAILKEAEVPLPPPASGS